MIKQKRSCEKEIKEVIRSAVTRAWDAGYKAGENGKKDDCKPEVIENIISDTWEKIRDAINDFLDGVGDWVNDKWTDAEKKIKEMWGDIIPWN
jgi:ribosome modulation factor